MSESSSVTQVDVDCPAVPETEVTVALPNDDVMQSEVSFEVASTGAVEETGRVSNGDSDCDSSTSRDSAQVHIDDDDCLFELLSVSDANPGEASFHDGTEQVDEGKRCSALATGSVQICIEDSTAASGMGGTHESDKIVVSPNSSGISSEEVFISLKESEGASQKNQTWQLIDYEKESAVRDISLHMIPTMEENCNRAGGEVFDDKSSSSPATKRKLTESSEQSSGREASSETVPQKVSRNNEGELLRTSGSQRSETEQKGEVEALEPVSRRRSSSFSQSFASPQKKFSTSDRENENERFFDAQDFVADSSTTPLTAEVVSQTENAEETGEKSASNENKKERDDDKESSSEDEEEALLGLGERLENLPKGPYAQKIKKSVQFWFDVDCDIFELGLNEENLYCGVVIAFESGNASKTQFYAGGGGKLNINYKKGTMTVKGYIPKKEFEGRHEFSVKYAVSESPEKDVYEQSPDKLRLSQAPETRHEFVSGLTIGDKSGSVQKFTASQLSTEDNTGSPGNENGETERNTSSCVREAAGSECEHVVRKDPFENLIDGPYGEKNSAEQAIMFKFKIDCDSFGLGLEGTRLYCGVVLKLHSPNSHNSDQSQQTEPCVFYSGSKSFDPANGTMQIVVHVPVEEFQEWQKFSYAYAVCESSDKDMCEVNPEKFRFSEHFEALESTQPGSEINDSNVIQKFTVRNETLTENVVTKRKNQSRPVNVADTPSTTESDLQTSSSHQKTVSDTKTDASLVRKFSRIQSVEAKNTSGEECWIFKFHVGLNIFELGFEEQKPLYCGVAIMTEKDKVKTGTFYPGTTLETDSREKRQAVQVLIAKSDMPKEANKYFFYSYAISTEKNMRLEMQNSPSAGFLSSSQKITDVENNRLIEKAEPPSFVPYKNILRSHANNDKVETRSQTTRSSSNRHSQNNAKRTETKENTDTQNKTPGQNEEFSSGVPEDELGGSTEIDNDFVEKHHLKLRQTLLNRPIEDADNRDNDNCMELHAVVTSDLCRLGKTKLLVGVCSSVSKFEKITPGYIVAEVDGLFWIRFRVEIGTESFVEYKYVAAQPTDSEKHWELLHDKGKHKINRCVSRFAFKNKICKYDGAIAFTKVQNEKPQYFKWVDNAKKLWEKVTGDKNDPKLFYAKQSSFGLGVYLRSFVRQIFKKKLDIYSFRTQFNRILESCSKIEVGPNIPYRTQHHLFEKAEQFCTIFSIFSEIHDEYSMYYGESVELKVVVVAIFSFIASFRSNPHVLDTLDIENWEHFLRCATFTSGESKSKVAQWFDESSFPFQAVESSCLMMLDSLEIRKSLYFPVLFEWISFHRQTATFLDLPKSLTFNERLFEITHEVYVSKFTKKQLLLLFLKTNPSKLPQNLCFSIDEIVECYNHINETKTSSERRRDNEFDLLRSVYELYKSGKVEASFPQLANFLISITKLLTTTDRLVDFDLREKLVNKWVVIILDVLEIFYGLGVDTSNDSNELNFDGFVCKVSAISEKANNRNFRSFTASQVLEWGEILKPRDTWTSDSKKKLYTALSDVCMKKLLRLDSATIFELNSSIPHYVDSLKQKNPKFDGRSIEALLDGVVIAAIDREIDRNSVFSWDFRRYMSPLLEQNFVLIASKKFPLVTGDTHPLDVVFSILDWKPFIGLLEIKKRVEIAFMNDKLLIVHQSFQRVFEMVAGGDISFANWSKVVAHESEFKSVCLNMGLLDEWKLKTVLDKIKNRVREIQSSFEKTSKLKELLTKFNSSAAYLDMSELDQLAEDWQYKSINSFIDIKSVGEIVFTVKIVSREESDSVNRFLDLFKSRLFSKWAIQSVKYYCDSLQEVCHYSKLLNELLPNVEKKYLDRADFLVSGRLNAKEAQKMFNDFKNEQDKQEEIGFFFEYLQGAVPSERVQGIKDKLEERKRQVLKLDSLTKNLEFVTALNELKRLLEMERNFAELDILANVDKLDQYELRQLTPEILKCSEEFEGISREQVLAIKAFTKCPAFLAWIRQKMPSLQDVKVVAELASLSAGEIAYEIDKVKCFHDAVFGYAPFIYELNEDSQFRDVKRAYEKVFAKLDTDRKLPDKYEDSAHHQSWFEKALESQGSVEKSSLERALQINKSGCYIVGYRVQGSKRKVLIEQEDAVLLEYLEDCKSADGTVTSEKRKLDLTELRDLLSRLMLIVGKDKHEHAQSVDIFIATFQNVERLAASFVALFNSGCSFFDFWSVRITTSDKKLNLPALRVTLGNGKTLDSFTRETNEELSCLCVALESIKSKWEQYVFAMRCKRPVLNEFNTQQLKTLCSGLAGFKKSSSLDPSSRYYIDSLNDGVTLEKIEQFLYEDEEDVDMDVDDEVDCSFGTANSLTLDEITRNAHIDERSNLLNLIDSLKSQFNDNESLAKAGIQALRAQSQDLDEAEAINWIVEHEDQDEIVAQMAEDFDQHFSSLDRTENTEIGVDTSGNKMDVSEFAQKMELVFDKHLSLLKENGLEDFVNLFQLGHVLDRCLEDATVTKDPEAVEAPFPEHFKRGKPNLVLCEKRSDILLQLLSLYRHMSAQTLPKPSQVLVCSSRTSVEEVEVFLLRSMLDKRCRVFCMAFAEDLSAACADHLEKLLFEKVKKRQSDYKLVVFSSDDSCQVSVVLEKFKTKMGCESPGDLRRYVRNNLRVQEPQKVVDDYRSRLIWSSQPSSGKSLHIDNLEANMKRTTRNGSRIVLRLFDRGVDFEKLLDFLWQHKDVTNPTLIHLDVSPNVVDNVEELLFKLCVLGGLSDERGKLFLLKPNCCLMVELLRPQECSAWKSICDLFPSTACLSPNECLRNMENEDNASLEFMGADANLINSPAFQRSYHYLEAVHNNRDITNYTYNGERQNDRAVIETLKRDSGLRNPTWAQLSFFAQFLDEQLEACENNVFVNCGDFTGLKNFLVKHCLIKMAQDFALPSLSIADNSPLFGLDGSNTNYQVHQIRRRWENHPHPYVFFNADQVTLTFLGVRVENSHLKDWKGNVLAQNVMSPDLEQQIRRQAYDESNILAENFDGLSVGLKQLKLCRVLGVDQFMEQIKFDPTYELTQDNVMKLLAIYMRFRCNIPVVIMGETGCGKTRLIEFLCHLMSRGQTTENKKFVKVHGGVTMADITRNIEEAERLAVKNTKKYGDGFYTVLFFDEANTTEAIYGIKEVICDFSVNGRKIDPNSGLKVIVACNPYRKHDLNMIKKLESQGLGYHVKSSETKDKLDSDIPMRHLVYRVNPLPPSLLPLVWDFGQLTSEVENKYIRQIVWKRRIDLRLSDKDVDFIVHVLSISQMFLRKNRDQCLFVSLRDIERAMTVLAFFHSRSEQLLGSMDDMNEEKNYSSDDEERPEPVKEIARLMILTLGVCYHASLEKRDHYRKAIAKAFKGDYALPNGAKTIERELDLCMEVFLDKIVLDAKANIAKNLALSENVFMMIICIELRIPLFLVGKPGSSKSLAKTIVLDAMQGEASKNDFFRELKQVQMLSFQCSPHTHADGIISTFKQAALYQKGKALSEFVSVVLLDEIGLAEDSAKMPLKTLHPLLEEGYVEEGEAHCEWGKVAFVGISNWALDPAKMNRGILVSRTIPTSDELVKSANGICRTRNEGKSLERLISPLAQAYEEIYKKQMNELNAEYFGLRDFYGLLKMLYRCSALTKSQRNLKWSDVRAAIRRNFGEKGNGSLEIFAKHLRDRVFENVSMIDQLDTLELVKQNIQEAEARSQMSEEERNMDNESRYLLLMTENFSALQLLPQVLNLNDCEIIFGSSFPQDQEYIQVCKNINRIKICMETGRTVVLLNLGSLYESLYDALNQYYSYYGGKRYVDLGLGSNRVKCSVSENFRLIMIEEEKVAKQFPIPLLNRLEKHFLGMESILPPNLVKLRTKLSERLEDFSQVRRQDKDGAYFQVRDAFVGYQQDTTACVLIQSSVSIDQNTADDENVLSWAEYKLMQTCSIEAILRVDLGKASEGSLSKYKDAYSHEGRNSLAEFLRLQCYGGRSKSPLIEVSTFRRIPSSKNIKDCNLELMKKEGSVPSQERHFVVNLNVFKTEIEFAERVKDFYRMARKQPAELTKVLFVTCSKGQRFVHLIASAKYCLQNLHTDAHIPNLFTLFIVELPRYWYESGYSSFSVGKWESFHIDELFKEQDYAVLSEVAVGQIRDFRDLFVLEGTHCSPFQRRLLRDVVHEAVADSGGGEKVQRVSNVFRLFEEHHVPSLEVIFLEKARRFIETTDHYLEIDKWVAEKAANLQELIKSGTIENALFTELKTKIKPHLADFLKSIDFNNNIKLLFEGSWRKTAWMQLFSVKELCQMRLENTKEVKFDPKFPFSTEVIQRMNHYWNESLENYKDHQGLQDWQFFVERFHNQGIELFETLKDISREEDAVDSFIHDLVLNSFGSQRSKFVQMEVMKLVKNAVKSIMAEQVANADERNIGAAYAIFMKLSLHLHDLFPVLREFAGSLAIRDATSIEQFSHLVLESALSQLKDLADKLKPSSLDNQKILDLESKVHVVKASVESVMSGDDRLMFTFKRVGLLSTYLSQISHNLGDAQKNSCTAADTLYKSVSAANATEDVFGCEQFLKRLLFCLSRSAEALIQLCVECETGTKDCSFCKKTVAAKGAVPFCIPCPRRHVVHKDCLKTALDDEDENGLRCSFCTAADLNRDMLRQSTPFNCQTDAVRQIWSQFWENISGTFLRIVEEFIIPNGSEGCMKQLVEMCLIYKSDTDSKNPHWFTESIKRSILTLISMSDFAPTMDSILSSAIQQDRDLGSNCVEWEKTNDFLLSAFEYIYDNFPNADFDFYSNSSIPGQLRLIAYLKMETRRFVAETVAVNAAKQQDHAKIRVPKVIRDFLQVSQTSAEAADCLRHYFVQCICREHGMELYRQVKKIQELHQLIPQILLTSQSQGFSDIFLVLGASYQNPLSQIYQSLLENVETAMQVVNGLDPFTRNVVVYRLMYEIAGREEAPLQMAQFLDSVLNRAIGGLPECVTNQNHVLCPLNRTDNLMTHFLFLEHQFLTLRDNCGPLQPFKDILNNNGHVQHLYLPTFPDSLRRHTNVINQTVTNFTTWNQCPNGHLYLIGDCGRPNAAGRCPDCGAGIGGGQHNFQPGNANLGNRGQNVNAPNSASVTGYLRTHNLNMFERNVTEFTGNVMQFFIHTILYLSTNEAEMRVRAQKNVQKLARNVFARSEDDVFKFLTSLLNSSPQFQNGGSFVDENQREMWEQRFAVFIDQTKGNLERVIAAYDDAFKRDSRNESNNLIQVLEVAVDASSTGQFLAENKKFWVRKAQVSVAALKSAFSAQTDQFPLLKALFKNEPYLEYLSHIPDLFWFFDRILEYYDADQAHLVKTFDEFVRQKRIPTGDAERMKQVAELYCRVWNSIVRKQRIMCQYKDSLSLSSHLKYFVPSSHVSECCALVAMDFLVAKNNELVEAYTRGSGNSGSSLDNGSVRLEHVVSIANGERKLENELASTLSNFASRDGATNSIRFDFGGIERSIGRKFFRFKPIIGMKLFKLKVKSSSTKEALNKARVVFSEDESLSGSQLEKIQERFTDMPEVCRMLRQLVLLMKYLEKKEQVQTIGEFLGKIKIEAIAEIESYDLKYCVALWQALALQKTCLMMQHDGEDPYPGIMPEFREQLSSSQEKDIRKMKKKNKQKLMLLLNEFVSLNLDERDLMKPGYHIEKDCLDVYFCDETGLALPDWMQLRYAERVMIFLIEDC